MALLHLKAITYKCNKNRVTHFFNVKVVWSISVLFILNKLYVYYKLLIPCFMYSEPDCIHVHLCTINMDVYIHIIFIDRIIFSA